MADPWIGPCRTITRPPHKCKEFCGSSLASVSRRPVSLPAAGTLSTSRTVEHEHGDLGPHTVSKAPTETDALIHIQDGRIDRVKSRGEAAGLLTERHAAQFRQVN